MFPNALTPHADERGQWRVELGSVPATDLKGLVVRVPAPTDDGFALAACIHEGLHVRFTPRDLGKIEPEVNAVEDCRIQCLGLRHDATGWAALAPVTEQLAGSLLDGLAAIAHPTQEDRWRLANSAVAAYPSGGAAALLEGMVASKVIDKRLRDRIEARCRALQGDPMDRKAWQSLVSLLTSLRPRSGMSGLADRLGGLLPRSGSSSSAISMPADLWAALRPGTTVDPGEARPGQMEVVHPPLNRVVVSGARRLRRSDCGVLYQAGRVSPVGDGLAFRCPSRATRAGTVLIDASGSMSPDAEVIHAIVERSSAVTVALYAGCPIDNSRGRLLIVAAGGRVAEDLQAGMRDHLGYANVVDIPALEWLSQRPAPRVWVSDGNVTGVGDICSPAITARAAEICRAAGVRRVLSLQEAAATLR